MGAGISTKTLAGVHLPRLAIAVGLYLAALILMCGSVPTGIHREAVRIDGPDNKPCLATIWTPSDPKAVILLGHGVTANQGVMATAAKAFACDGYIAVAFDFWGHGRSTQRFDWTANPAQVRAWCAWAHGRFQGLPLAYLGHSMGGFAGAEAFGDKPEVAAFVAMGALPSRMPSCKTLVAAGRFEELFSTEQARRVLDGKADFVSSPFSDHALETWDPVLIRRVVAWTDAALGLDPQGSFPWLPWLCAILGVVLGCAGALMLAEQTAAIAHDPGAACSPDDRTGGNRTWSVNPYRLAGRALGYTGRGTPPRSGALRPAIVRGIAFSAVFVLLLSSALNTHIFTCRPDHPGRFVLWVLLAPFMALLFLLDAQTLERVALTSARTRFAVSALTRAIPLAVLCIALRFASPGLAFAGMMLGILACIAIVLAAIHAMATRGTGDYRAGAVASGILFAWVIAFWFPLVWV